MTDTQPEADRPIPSSDINPVRTVLIKIGGAVLAVLGALLFGYGVLLAVAFGGTTPLWLGIVQEPVMWVFLLIVAAGVALVFHARRRERLYRQFANDRFRTSGRLN